LVLDKVKVAVELRYTFVKKGWEETVLKNIIVVPAFILTLILDVSTVTDILEAGTKDFGSPEESAFGDIPKNNWFAFIAVMSSWYDMVTC